MNLSFPICVIEHIAAKVTYCRQNIKTIWLVYFLLIIAVDYCGKDISNPWLMHRQIEEPGKYVLTENYSPPLEKLKTD